MDDTLSLLIYDSPMSTELKMRKQGYHKHAGLASATIHRRFPPGDDEVRKPV
jgi:hypothetical protein